VFLVILRKGDEEPYERSRLLRQRKDGGSPFVEILNALKKAMRLSLISQCLRPRKGEVQFALGSTPSRKKVSTISFKEGSSLSEKKKKNFTGVPMHQGRGQLSVP